jgi:hypothetical protein
MTAAEPSIDAASQADITRGAIARLAKEGGRMTAVAIAVFCWAKARDGNERTIADYQQ